MSSKTKIVVLHMKEIIYTVVIALLISLLIGLFFFMFSSRTSPPDFQEKRYTPGVYSSPITLNNTELSVEVSVDEQYIQSVRISNLNETITTMYPLLQPTIEDLADQLAFVQSIDEIELSTETPYTSRLLLNAVETALTQARN